MRHFTLSLPKDQRPTYLKIAAGLRKAIRDEYLKPGELLPSTRELAVQLNVHRQTVMAALGELVAEGWLVSEPRRGYLVAKDLPAQFHRSPTPSRSEGHTSASLSRAASLIRDKVILVECERPAPTSAHWDFRSGRADLRLLPFEELKTHWNSALKRHGTRLLDYADPAGHPPFVRELERYLRRVRNITHRDIVVTHGSQEAIYILAHLFLKPGDVVAAEALNYPAARHAFYSTGASVKPIAIDREGIDPTPLEALCRRKKVRLIYLTPLHQYPTSATLPVPRRLAIYQIAAKHGIPILEDDYDHEYHYRCQPLPPMAADDPEGLVLYVSTLSKILSPSSRLGFAALPKGLLPQFLNIKKVLTAQNDSLMQDAVARWMRTDGFQRHLSRTRRAYAHRLDQVIQELERYQALGISWVPADGGMALWLKTPWDTQKLADLAARRGLLLQPEAPTRMDGKSGKHLRLGFARPRPEEMRAGLRQLLDVAQMLS